MPTYEYVCPAGHEFERFERKISDKSRRKCPECGKMAQRSISGGGGLLFKGSGFYHTDYKQQGSGDKQKEESGKAEKSDKAEKSESKAEKKSDSSTKKASGDSS